MVGEKKSGGDLGNESRGQDFGRHFCGEYIIILLLL